MAFRTLMQFGQTGKCIFTNVNCPKTFLNVQNTAKYTRGFKRLRDSSANTIKSPLSNVSADSTIPSSSKLWRPIGFTILFVGATHVGAVIWEYEKVRSRSLEQWNIFISKQQYRRGFRSQLYNWWCSLSEGTRIFIPICFLNIIVYSAWKLPALRTTMNRYFLADSSSRKICLPMILSTFSHSSLLHLAINMYVLHTFSKPAVHSLGREQFVAFYLTSGVTASLLSHLHKIAFNLPGRSLGASGAIMGVLGYVCLNFPESRLGIVVLPMITFSAGNAIKGIIAMDLIGCALRWRFLDHAAHLGGVLWGIFWHMWGKNNIWNERKPLLDLWHGYRKKIKKDE